MGSEENQRNHGVVAIRSIEGYKYEIFYYLIW